LIIGTLNKEVKKRQNDNVKSLITKKEKIIGGKNEKNV